MLNRLESIKSLIREIQYLISLIHETPPEAQLTLMSLQARVEDLLMRVDSMCEMCDRTEDSLVTYEDFIDSLSIEKLEGILKSKKDKLREELETRKKELEEESQELSKRLNDIRGELERIKHRTYMEDIVDGGRQNVLGWLNDGI